MIASPTPLAVNGAGAPSAQTVTVTESGYVGLFSESDNCAGIATVTTANAHGPSATYTVTGVSSGTCTLTFSDTNGQHPTVALTVTISGFTINTKRTGRT